VTAGRLVARETALDSCEGCACTEGTLRNEQVPTRKEAWARDHAPLVSVAATSWTPERTSAAFVPSFRPKRTLRTALPLSGRSPRQLDTRCFVERIRKVNIWATDLQKRAGG
jgi:hypothetical protein